MVYFLPSAAPRPTTRSQRMRRRNRSRRVSLLAFLVEALRPVPFVVQFAVVELLAIALGGFIGDVLGGAAAARDLGLN